MQVCDAAGEGITSLTPQNHILQGVSTETLVSQNDSEVVRTLMEELLNELAGRSDHEKFQETGIFGAVEMTINALTEAKSAELGSARTYNVLPKAINVKDIQFESVTAASSGNQLSEVIAVNVTIQGEEAKSHIQSTRLLVEEAEDKGETAHHLISCETQSHCVDAGFNEKLPASKENESSISITTLEDSKKSKNNSERGIERQDMETISSVKSTQYSTSAATVEAREECESDLASKASTMQMFLGGQISSRQREVLAKAVAKSCSSFEQKANVEEQVRISREPISPEPREHVVNVAVTKELVVRASAAESRKVYGQVHSVQNFLASKNHVNVLSTRAKKKKVQMVSKAQVLFDQKSAGQKPSSHAVTVAKQGRRQSRSVAGPQFGIERCEQSASRYGVKASTSKGPGEAQLKHHIITFADDSNADLTQRNERMLGLSTKKAESVSASGRIDANDESKALGNFTTVRDAKIKQAERRNIEQLKHVGFSSKRSH